MAFIKSEFLDKEGSMKTKWMIMILAAAFLIVSAASLSAQALSGIVGKATDQDGKPIPDAQIQIKSEDTGQQLVTKTDSKGTFTQIGLNPGSYKVSLVKDNKVLWFFDHVPVHLQPDGLPMRVDFDLKKEAASQMKSATPEQQAAQAEAQKKQQQQTKLAALNQQIVQANALEQAGNWDQAITILTQAADTAPQADLLWAQLGRAQLGAGDASQKSGDKAAATDHYQKAVDSYQKAIQIKPAEPNYHNNLGQAFAKIGKPDQAVQEYTQAAQASPTNAAMFYFNLGATLTNQATKETNQETKNKDIDAANQAFDKAIAANPDYAEAWYQKGINLLSKATYDKSGNIVPAPGTADAFQKYLQVAPTGPHAEEAKSMIASLGGKVETSYKKPKSK